MNAGATILEILKYTIPALVVLIGTSTIIGRFLKSEVRRKQLAIFGRSQDITLPLRLQAYERLVLFLERMSPRNLIPRVYHSEMTVRDLQMAMISGIRDEYEHNLSQQIYVSKNAWDSVKGAKEQEMAVINRISDTLNPEAAARELHIRILEVIAAANTELPSEMAIYILNAEVKTVMQQGSV